LGKKKDIIQGAMALNSTLNISLPIAAAIGKIVFDNRNANRSAYRINNWQS
jgi:hypothetical protein